jgi:hypothetical protein
MRNFRWLFFGLIALASTACTAPPGAIFKEFELQPGHTSVTTDNRQRLVTNVNPLSGSQPGVVNPRNIVCVEPAPPVAAALASSVGAGLSLFNYGSASTTASVAESLVQLEERTMSIQALLNSGYQNCLDYANGAVSRTFYAIRAQNLDDLMVTLVLADSAAGNYGRSLAGVGTSARGSAEASLTTYNTSIGDMQEAARSFGEADRNVRERQTALANSKAEYEAAERKALEAKTASDAAPTDATLKTAATQARQDADAKKEAAAAAEKSLIEAENQREGLRQLLQSTADTAAESAAGLAQLTAAGGITGRPSDGVAATISDMQRRFIERGAGNEYVTACLVEMGFATRPGAAMPASMKGNLGEITGQLARALADTTRDQKARVFDGQAFFQLESRERQSVLLAHCEQSLGEIARVNLAEEYALARLRLDNERLYMAVQYLDRIQAAERSCDALQGSDTNDTARLRKTCRDDLKRLVDAIPLAPGPLTPLVPRPILGLSS